MSRSADSGPSNSNAPHHDTQTPVSQSTSSVPASVNPQAAGKKPAEVHTHTAVPAVVKPVVAVEASVTQQTAAATSTAPPAPAVTTPVESR